jgi:imidazolonepropionase
MLTLWRNARIATCDEASRIHAPGAVLTEAGRIAWIGTERDVPAGTRPRRTIELGGRWLTPGLVDCHTHLVFAGQRASEFAQRTSGRSYSEIAQGGGGILSTMRATRAASEAELFEGSRPRLASLLAEGVTTVEIKSGYGLTLESEARMLRTARKFGSEPNFLGTPATENRLGAEFPDGPEAGSPVTVSTSFLGAHALPPEYAGRADDYIDVVAKEWLPALAGAGLVDAVDAWCEDIAFTAAQCERVFAAAAKLNLRVRLHSEQLSNVGGSQLAARHRALSCDHLEYTTDADAAALAAAGTVAVLLPIAFYTLAEKQLPPIDAFRRERLPLAVASDSNPGSAPGASLLLAMNMARRSFGLTSEEVLLGTTRHAARALAVEGERGSLTQGRAADFAVWSIDTLDELGYWVGFNPCSMAVKEGEIVLERAV